ncbi:MAG: class I SAM-dependent methyltransferase, partial [Chloroflexi bacterium]|nr:class I SAM-dependent methyltransferase [Chloroflexota bacterium]
MSLPRTLLLTLRARAAETQLFTDETAARWADQLPWPDDLAAFLTPGFAASFAVRTRLLDARTDAFLTQHPSATVVELGAGLSTRPQRLGVDRARWLLLDLPEAVAMRQQVAQPDAHINVIEADLLHPDWAASLGASAPVLFIAEGVLLFLPPQGIGRLFGALGSAYPGARILLDAAGHGLRARQAQRFTTINAPLGWTVGGLADVEALGVTIRATW